jgi:hypothetical protein
MVAFGRESFMGWNFDQPANTALLNTDYPRRITRGVHRITRCKRILKTPTYFWITTGNSGGEYMMDPDLVPVMTAFIGGAAVFFGRMVNDLLSARREEEKLKWDDKQEWLESRKRAYYKFIEVFSSL